MVMLPKNPNTTQNKIDEGIYEKGVGRNYMGLSGIGDECIRRLQYTFHMAFERETGHRLHRIFETGNKSEEFMIADLARIGIKVWGEQDEIVGFAGHWRGHIDGRALGVIESPLTPHLLEMKTHNEKSFNGIRKHGVRKSKPVHYDQMQIYMDGIGYDRALYLAYNKNTSEYYIERIKLDLKRVKELKVKQQIVLFEEYPVQRIGSNSPDFFMCRFCNASDLCFRYTDPLENCGTCEYRDVYDNWTFKCAKQSDKILNWAEMLVGCGKWQLSDFFKKVTP